MVASKKQDKPISRASAPRLLPRGKNETDGIPDKLSFGSESSKITSLKAPAPLPPLPADDDVGGWLEPMKTDPTKIPDLGALAATGHTDPGSLPGWAKGSRQASANDELTESTRASAPAFQAAATRPAARPQLSLVVIGLLMAVCLAVGMILGAILQNQSAPPACPDPTVHHEPAHPASGS